MSYEKDKLDSYVTSASLATALSPYITSASVATAIAGIDLTAYVSSNSLSAAVATNTLTVRGTASVSATMSAGAVTVAGRSVNTVLLGYQAISNVTSFSFSGSWSDYPILEITAFYQMSGSATASITMFTDGGTTAFLSGQSGLLGGTNSVEFFGRFLGGDNRPWKYTRSTWYGANGVTNFATLTSTATAGFLNCIKMVQSRTMSGGMAMLIGYRNT